ncbi:histone H1B-like [Coccinella septempunctata]|uniref:histone H1B-like n=2 Tax=Coccinella septempunctata TaxID=41139 RepID=UPI001D074726|nr:histone H1B-like [Coccinella septempunctata]
MTFSTSESEMQQATTPATAVGKTLNKAEKKTSARSKHVKPSHPPTSDMVDYERLAPFIRKYLKTAVQSGSLIQTKGKGASGSFKLAAGGSTTNASKKVAKKLVKSADGANKNASPTMAADKKNTSPARSTSTVSRSKKRAAIAKEKKSKLTKSPSKAKKANKSPTKKPKAPKPKTVKSVTAPKKVTSPKKKKRNTAVQSGSLIQTKGKGASGSFKLAAGGSTTNASKKVAKKLVKSADGANKNASPTMAADKKNTSPARSTSTVSRSKKRAAIAKEKKSKLTKSPSIAKKANKSPTKKPKAPKPKTVKSVTAPKKVTSPKKKK